MIQQILMTMLLTIRFVLAQPVALVALVLDAVFAGSHEWRRTMRESITIIWNNIYKKYFNELKETWSKN